MILLILILGFTAASAEEIEGPKKNCTSCVIVNKTCYNATYMFDLQAPFRKRVVIPKMGILKSKNLLFFSFEPIFEDEEYYKTGFVKLSDGGSTGIISGGQILNLGTFDIDQDNNLIYFGGNDGIFVLDTTSNKMSSYSSRGDTISNIFYKNKVYFSKYAETGVIVKNGDYFRTLYEKILMNNFVVTKYDVFVFLNNTGLHISKGDIVHKLSINPFFRGLTIDMEGTVYAWWIDGIYKVVINKNLEHSKLVQVAVLPEIGAMTFDQDNNILFTIDKSLYVLKETEIYGCDVVDKESSV